jgi:3-oxoacyl-[acyl-carrier protein] reductase
MKTALVTGASKGIGRSVAITLAKNGYSVAINFKSDKKNAEEVLDVCNTYSEKNILVQGDVSEEEDVLKIMHKIKDIYKNIDVLVNNAGIFDETDSVTNTDAFKNIFKNNLLSVILVTKFLVPLMRNGRIINISSVHGKEGGGRPGAAAYSAMKAALENYTINLAKELAPGILVNAIAPGRINTSMWNIETESEKIELGKIHLIERMIEPEEIADTVLFLTNSNAITGTVLMVDGGYGLK